MSLDPSSSLDGIDASTLSSSDKRELQQFLQSEEQKANIQMKVHTLTSTCFKKCITSEGRALEKGGNTLDRSEEPCMQNCVGRYMDANMAVLRHLERMRTLG